ncbi:trp operon leader peptide [Salmonella enterica subsp. indica]|uniref:trp operon leader peptide n=2 Tax=Salmonella enterica TaxID=28901 RepID=A0A5Y2QGM5_SALER|nr:trp operon leader peptide [Salmonella enterica]EBP3214464.1 trp operon leader peptide [Salmonella enterica subsp. arizonae]ECI8272876.1 trp operon leader peptide [Salmonella enterica subsp. enterica]EDR2771114.1 trp operon leader peptide [Salmonella enterica subsp. enterica serovar Oslo]EEC4250343.1 trp operon leader peptide [Salmonella enterica subsp. diarizonae]HAE8194125.1 trp operon leader peptide [Salmonella enterica subsp. indica serovar 41:b:1,7]HCM1933025.1 trp operon leader peptid
MAATFALHNWWRTS